jgi:hypothetical protein
LPCLRPLGHIVRMRFAPNDTLEDWIDQVLEADPLTIDVDDDDEPQGPPLTDGELDGGQQFLIEWRSPQDFSSKTQTMCRRCRSADYFNQPRLKFLHDAYVLAEFVKLKQAESVRLAAPSERWPDGFIKLQGQTYNVEVTSTHGGRKLGQEYRKVSGPTLDSVKNWVARADSIPKYLDEAISTKRKKNYASPCWLVVYLNINEYDIRQAETEQVIAATKARHAEGFVAISVLRKGKLY